MILDLWIKLNPQRLVWVWLPGTLIVYWKKDWRLNLGFSKCSLNQLWVIGSSTPLANASLFELSSFFYELQTTVFNKCLYSCFLIATSNKQPPGRTLARPCFRWTRQLLLILCQSSNRTLWTQPVVSIYSQHHLTIYIVYDMNYYICIQ